MQVRWNFKLKPTKSQRKRMSQWLVTLRKHRNFALREREVGYSTNNQDVEGDIAYAWGSWCDIESKIEYGSCCPLTCPVLKHGVVPEDLSKALKVSKDRETGSQFQRITTETRTRRSD